MEEYFYEEEQPKHIFVKCLIILFLFGLLGGALIYYKKENTVRIKNVTVEVGSKLSTNVNDYLKSGNRYASKYKLYLKNVNVNEVGKYTYRIRYNKHTKTGYINVVDTTSPKVTLDNNVTISTSDEFDPSIFVLKCEDYSLPCSVNLKNKNDLEKLNVVGEYNIDIVISDTKGNKTDETVKVTITNEKTSSKMTDDLEYFTNSANEDLKHTMFIKLNSAISEESKEFEDLFLETSSTDFNEFVDNDIYSTRIITAYNKYGYVIGLQVEITFYDGTKKLLEEKVE